MRLIMAEPKKLSFNETLKAFGTVAITTYKASPLAAITKIIGTIIGSAIPLVTALRFSYRHDTATLAQKMVYR